MLAQPGRHGRRDERIRPVHQHPHHEQHHAVPAVAAVVHRPAIQRQRIVVQGGEVDVDGAERAHQGVVEEEDGDGHDEHERAGGGAHARPVGEKAGHDAADYAAIVEDGGEGGRLGGVHTALFADILGQPEEECVAASRIGWG